MATPEIPTGSNTIFQQTNAPTGWTKITTYNDYAIRLVTGTAGNVSSSSFSTVFASTTPTGNIASPGTTGAFTLTNNELAPHTHTLTTNPAKVSPAGKNGPGPAGAFSLGGPSTGPYANTGSTGGGLSHTHPITITSPSFTGTAINLAINYVDVILAQRN